VLAFDGRHIRIANQQGNSVTEFSVATGRLIRMPTG